VCRSRVVCQQTRYVGQTLETRDILCDHWIVLQNVSTAVSFSTCVCMYEVNMYGLLCCSLAHELLYRCVKCVCLVLCFVVFYWRGVSVAVMLHMTATSMTCTLPLLREQTNPLYLCVCASKVIATTLQANSWEMLMYVGLFV
jgi:hypothetical protein